MVRRLPRTHWIYGYIQRYSEGLLALYAAVQRTHAVDQATRWWHLRLVLYSTYNKYIWKVVGSFIWFYKNTLSSSEVACPRWALYQNLSGNPSNLTYFGGTVVREPCIIDMVETAVATPLSQQVGLPGVCEVCSCSAVHETFPEESWIG